MNIITDSLVIVWFKNKKNKALSPLESVGVRYAFEKYS